MKRINILALLFILFLSLSNYVIAQNEAWIRKQPTPQEHPLYCVRQIPGTQTIVAVGSGSTIMYSEDNGTNWDITYNPAGLPNKTKFLSVAFYDGQIGYAVANYGKIIHTTDGGINWELVYDANCDTLDTGRADIYLIDEETAIVVGFNRVILKTENSGLSWNTIVCPQGFYPNSIDFVNENTGYIVGYGNTAIILKTTDKGDSWMTQAFFPGVYSKYDIYFMNNTEGIISATSLASTDTTFVFKTDDAGNSWRKVYTIVNDIAGEIDFKNETQGAIRIYSWTNSFLFTQDGGETWTPDNNPAFNNYSPCYSFCNNTDCMIAVGHRGLIGRSNDNGGTWEGLSSNTIYGKCTNALFTSGTIGYAQFQEISGGITNDVLLKTIDGGNNWNFTYSGLFLGNFSFYDDNNGYLLNIYYGEVKLFKTIDGGETWNQMYYFGDFDIGENDPVLVSFFDSDHGIVSFNGIIYKTEDGGQSWQTILETDDTDDVFSSMVYKSVDTLFFTNYLNQKPVIVKTFDGGMNFSYDTLDLLHYYADKIYFKNNNGYIILNEFRSIHPIIYKSNDSGQSWHSIAVSDTKSTTYNDVFFATPDIGYIAASGNYTTILKTSDGGESWYPLEIPCTSSLSHVYFHDDWHGFVFGNSGVIFETLTGGVVGENENFTPASNCDHTISPNPATNIIQIKLDEKIGNHLIIDIYNITGELFLTDRIHATQNDKAHLNISELPSGLYFARIRDGDHICTTRFVKF